MIPDQDSAVSPSFVSEQILSGWRYRAVIYSVMLSAVGYLGFSLWGGWHDVSTAASHVGLLGMLFALSLSLVNYGLRFLRWQAYLNAMGHVVPWRPSLRIYLAGFALTTTPGKLGETLRAVLLKRWDVPYPQSLAAFFSERLSDLLAVVLLALLGLNLYPYVGSLVGVGAVLVIGVFLTLSNQSLLRKFEVTITGKCKPKPFLRIAFQVLYHARTCHQPRMLFRTAVLSVVAWAAEAWAFFLILQWMGTDVSLAFAVFVYSISMLAGALSFVPGGLGGAEAAMIASLIWKGTDNADAVAATVLIRLVTLWFAVGLGLLSLLIHRQRSIRND